MAPLKFAVMLTVLILAFVCVNTISNDRFGPGVFSNPTGPVPSIGRGAGSPFSGSNTWTNLNPTIAPPPRTQPALAFDSRSGEIIVFGGHGYFSQVYNDTWTYNVAANTWTNRSPAVHPESYPYVSGSIAMSYDSRADRTILFGGCQVNPYLGACNQTWTYDAFANTWSKLSVQAGPHERRDFGLVYDSSVDRVILFGGNGFNPEYETGSNQTWAYDYGNDTWTQLQPPTSPSRRWGASMAYDPFLGRTYLFGGCSDLNGMTCGQVNDTWMFDYPQNAWTRIVPISSPPICVPPPYTSSRCLSLPMVYDDRVDRLILFGRGGFEGNETWTYDVAANAWVDQNPSVKPPARSGAAMAFDSQSNRAVLFGGSQSNVLLNDTWAFDYGYVAPGRPSAPGSLQAAAGLTEGQVTLTWEPPANNGGYSVLAYRVYRGTNSGMESFLLEVGDVLTYSDHGLGVLTTYYYEVTAVNAAGEGAPSTEASVTPPDLTSPTIAILLPADNANLTSPTVNVSGTASDNVGVAIVEVTTNASAGPWILAQGTTSWHVVVTLREGINTIWARAKDTSQSAGVTVINVTVTQATGGSTGGMGPHGTFDGPLPLAAAAVGALTAAFVAGAVILVRRKGRGKEKR